MAVKLGDKVIYTDGNGHDKLAFVVATPESLTQPTSVELPGEDEANLVIFGPTGAQYGRTSIRQGEGPRTFRVHSA